jgi:hypothetical protein
MTIGIKRTNLLRHREAWTALVADKAKIPGAIQEILRYAQFDTRPEGSDLKIQETL